MDWAYKQTSKNIGKLNSVAAIALLAFVLDCHGADGLTQIYSRTEHHYAVPNVTVTTQDHQKINLSEALNHNGPVLLNFIFTSCNAICPVISAIFAKTQGSAQPIIRNLKLVSISIDPEQDTPAMLKLYAKKFNAGENWFFLTGAIADIEKIQMAFDVYRGDKMNHASISYLKFPKSDSWIRMEGLVSSSELIKQIKSH